MNAPEPDRIHGSVLKSCADQLAEVLTDIFSMALGLSVIPTCFMKTTLPLFPRNPPSSA